jgi:chromosome segregation ATPase
VRSRLGLALAVILATNSPDSASASEDNQGSTPRLLVPPRNWKLPELPKKEELRFEDLSKCFGAGWDAPKRARDLETSLSQLGVQSEALRGRTDEMDRNRAALEADEKALALALEELSIVDAAIISDRTSIEKSKSAVSLPPAEVSRLKASIAALNERVGKRNQKANELRARATDLSAKVSAFNASLQEANSASTKFNEAVGAYNARVASFKKDLEGYEAGCVGERRMVK